MPLVLTEAEGRPAVNSSYISSINPADGQCLQEKYSDEDCNFALLGNLYACEGKPGKVIPCDMLYVLVFRHKCIVIISLFLCKY